jgi:hypothetical protein
MYICNPTLSLFQLLTSLSPLPPSLSSSSLLYVTGDILNIYVPFTKPLSVFGSVRLLLRGVYDIMSADYLSGDGSNVLTFTYEVQPYDLTPRLDTL